MGKTFNSDGEFINSGIPREWGTFNCDTESADSGNPSEGKTYNSEDNEFFNSGINVGKHLTLIVSPLTQEFPEGKTFNYVIESFDSGIPSEWENF